MEMGSIIGTEDIGITTTTRIKETKPEIALRRPDRIHEDGIRQLEGHTNKFLLRAGDRDDRRVVSLPMGNTLAQFVADELQVYGDRLGFGHSVGLGRDDCCGF
jgi:hypothetical protein